MRLVGRRLELRSVSYEREGLASTWRKGDKDGK